VNEQSSREKTCGRRSSLSGLTYRLHEEKDIPGLCQLWEQEAGWGRLSPEEWRQWFVETPLGDCIVAVVLDAEGEVAGQEVLTPSTVSVDSRETKGLRISAPILRKDLRHRSIKDPGHPVIRLWRVAEAQALERGFEVTYALPEKGWKPFFRWLGMVGIRTFSVSEFPCHALRLDAATDLVPPPHLEARRATSLGEEFNQLWGEAVKRIPIECGVVRGPRWLGWRNGAHVVVEVRDGRTRELVGFGSIKPETNLLFDFLPRSKEETGPVLRSVASWLGQTSNRKLLRGGVGMKVMATPPLLPALEELGFEVTDFEFTFVTSPLGDSLADQAVSTDRWYIMPGD
jgi:hypothetical protein